MHNGGLGETKQWKEDKEIVFTFQANGLEIDPSWLENLLNFWHEDMTKRVMKKYKNVDELAMGRTRGIGR